MFSCIILHYVVEKKHFCRYCLEAFSKEKILKRHIKDYIKINGKQKMEIPKKKSE